MIADAVVAGGAQEAALVFAVAEGDAVFVHVHGRHIALAVGMDLRLLGLPGLAVVLAAINGQRCGRVFVFDEGEDVAGGFINRGAAAVETGFGDGDDLAPGLAAIFAATCDDGFVAKGDEDRAFGGHDHVGEAFLLEDLLQLQPGFAEEGFERPFGFGVGGAQSERAHARSYEENREVSGHFFFCFKSLTGFASFFGSQWRWDAIMAACFDSLARLFNSCGSSRWS